LEVECLIDLGGEVLGLLVAPYLWVDDGDNSDGDSGSGQGGAACASSELATDSQVVIVGDKEPVAPWLHVFHLEAIFNTNWLLNASLLSESRHLIPDCLQVQVEEAMSLLCTASGRDTSLRLVSKCESLGESVATALKSQFLLNRQSDVIHIQVAL